MMLLKQNNKDQKQEMDKLIEILTLDLVACAVIQTKLGKIKTEHDTDQ